MGIETNHMPPTPLGTLHVASTINGGWGLKLLGPPGVNPVHRHVASTINGGWGLKPATGADYAELVEVASTINGGWGLKR